MSQRTLEEFGAYRKANELFIGILTATIERRLADSAAGKSFRVSEEEASYD